MPDPPEANPDGGYTFSGEHIKDLQETIWNILRAKNEEEQIGYTDKAIDLLPYINPNLIELEKALKVRHEREGEELNKRQLAERKHASPSEISALTQRHAKEQRDHLASYDADLKRHAKEQMDAQKLLKHLEDETRTDSLKPDQQPRRPT